MLDNYKIDQPIAYQIIKNAIDNNKFSHAYLIESNGYSHTYDFAIAFAKTLLSGNNDTLELKIIEPDGTFIKKEQIDELQSIYNEKAILGNKKVYIINGIEMMKEGTSNSLLKFLEEPAEGVIAILISNNSYQVPITVLSRCQILSLIKSNEKEETTKSQIARFLFNKVEDINNYIDSDESETNIQNVVNFIMKLEKEKVNTIIYTKKLWHENSKERKQVKEAFEIMLLFYKDVLNLKIGRNIEYFYNYMEELEKISKLNNIDLITKKINIIQSLKDKIKFNINLGLLIDKLIIEMDGCYND